MAGKKESTKSKAGTEKKGKAFSGAVSRSAGGTTVTKKSGSKKTVLPRKPSATPGKAAGPIFTAEERHHMIEQAAYYNAERRGFKCRCCERDWFDAAAEIDRMIKGG